VIQMTSTDDTSKNFSTCKRLIGEAKAKGATFVCLPECFNFLGGSSDASLKIAQSLDGSFISSYKSLAKEMGVWLSLGGFQETSDVPGSRKLKNTHVIIDNNGKLVSKYRKIHLFDLDLPGSPPLKESAFTEPGTSLTTCASPFGKLGLSICYDLRFPEMYCALRAAGSELLLIPAAFTKRTGIHWETLLRARAIENQCYVLAAAQAGRHNVKRETYGDAMIVDPWGTVIARCGCSGIEGVAIAFVDLERLRSIRRHMPVGASRRADIYGSRRKA